MPRPLCRAPNPDVPGQQCDRNNPNHHGKHQCGEHAPWPNVKSLTQRAAHLEGIDLRARRAFLALGIVTVQDLIQHCPAELRALPNCGPSTVLLIRHALVPHALTLAPDPPDAATRFVKPTYAPKPRREMPDVPSRYPDLTREPFAFDRAPDPDPATLDRTVKTSGPDPSPRSAAMIETRNLTPKPDLMSSVPAYDRVLATLRSNPPVASWRKDMHVTLEREAFVRVMTALFTHRLREIGAALTANIERPGLEPETVDTLKALVTALPTLSIEASIARLRTDTVQIENHCNRLIDALTSGPSLPRDAEAALMRAMRAGYSPEQAAPLIEAQLPDPDLRASATRLYRQCWVNLQYKALVVGMADAVGNLEQSFTVMRVARAPAVISFSWPLAQYEEAQKIFASDPTAI